MLYRPKRSKREVVMFARRLNEEYDFSIIENIHSELYARGKGHVKVAVLDGEESDLERILRKNTNDAVGEDISEYLQIKNIPIIPGRVIGEEFGEKTKENFKNRQKRIQNITQRQVAIFNDVLGEGEAGLYFAKFDAIPYAMGLLEQVGIKGSVVNRQKFMPQAYNGGEQLLDYVITLEGPKNQFGAMAEKVELNTYPFESTWTIGRYGGDFIDRLKNHIGVVQGEQHIGDALIRGPKELVERVEKGEYPIPTFTKYI